MEAGEGPNAEVGPDDVAEPLTEHEVDGKVHRGVEHLQGVGDVDEIELVGLAVLVLVAPDNLHDARGGLAQHEDEHDDDHDQGDVVLVLLPPTCHPLLAPANCLVGNGHPRVHKGQGQQRQHKAEQVVERVNVDLVVDLVATQGRSSPCGLRRAVGRHAVHYLNFKESWQVVEDGEKDDC